MKNIKINKQVKTAFYVGLLVYPTSSAINRKFI